MAGLAAYIFQNQSVILSAQRILLRHLTHHKIQFSHKISPGTFTNRHSESVNLHCALLEKYETVYSSVKQCSLLPLVSISWKLHEYQSKRYPLFPTKTDP